MSTQTATQFTCLRQELNQAVKALLDTKDKTGPNENEGKICSSTDICSALSRLQSMSRSLSRENQILRRLYFDNIYAREDNIADAMSGTFKWIVEENEDESIYSTEEDEYGSIPSTEEDYDEVIDSSEKSSNAEENLTRESLADEDELQGGEEDSSADLESGILVQVEKESNQGEEHESEIRDSESSR